MLLEYEKSVPKVPVVTSSGLFDVLNTPQLNIFHSSSTFTFSESSGAFVITCDPIRDLVFSYTVRVFLPTDVALKGFVRFYETNDPSVGSYDDSSLSIPCHVSCDYVGASTNLWTFTGSLVNNRPLSSDKAFRCAAFLLFGQPAGLLDCEVFLRNHASSLPIFNPLK